MASTAPVLVSGCDKPVEMPLTNVQKAERDKRIIKNDATLPEAEITGIIVSIMTKEDINALSVVTVNNPYSEVNPSGTINAPEMGTMDMRYQCKTCGKNSFTCPFHYGKISINRLIYDFSGLPYLPMVLNIICHSCGRPRIEVKKELAYGLKRYKDHRRLEQFYELVKKKSTCPHCNKINPHVTKQDNNILFEIPNSNEKVQTQVRTVAEILNKITDDDARAIGFNPPNSHPRYFVRDSVIAPPPSIRPQAVIGNMVKQNNLTKLYSDLVVLSANNAPNETVRTDIMNKLSEIFFNKENKKFIHKGDSQSCNKMIDGKKGIVRGFMMGKRKKHTARTVLIGDPELQFDQVRIPKEIADNMITSEKVTQYNIEKIRSYFGKTFEESRIFSIRPGSGENKDIYYTIRTEDKWKLFKDYLSEGDEIERYLVDGDPVMIGRQPTISSSGFIGSTVKIKDGLVFGIPMAYTTPMNADFDGDEAHKHPAQSSAVKVDVLYLANVKHRIMDSATNGSNFGIVYNGASSSYLMSRDNHLLPEDLWMEGYAISNKLQGEVGSETWEDFVKRCEKRNVPLLSTRALFSTLFPRDFWYEKGDLKIRCGIIIEGSVTKSSNGRGRNTILQGLFSQYGQEYCCTYLTYCQFLVDWYLAHYGLTITYNDCCIPDDKYHEFKRFKEEQIRLLNEKIEPLMRDMKDLNSFEKIFTEDQIREYIRATSVKIENKGKSYIKDNLDNPFVIMTTSGAKGSTENLSQIVSLVGQQLIYGQRPARIISDGQRTTPFFEISDNSVESQGFCKHSLSEGLDPEELFFYAMASRIGLLDTGVNVSVTGNMQRRIIKICEDQKIQAGGEVVSVNGSVYSYQLLDNCDPRYQVSTPGLLSFVDLKSVIGKLEEC